MCIQTFVNNYIFLRINFEKFAVSTIWQLYANFIFHLICNAIHKWVQCCNFFKVFLTSTDKQFSTYTITENFEFTKILWSVECMQTFMTDYTVFVFVLKLLNYINIHI